MILRIVANIKIEIRKVFIRTLFWDIFIKKQQIDNYVLK